MGGKTLTQSKISEIVHEDTTRRQELALNKMHRSSRNRSHLSNTEDVASVAIASRQATNVNSASRDPQGTPQQRDPPNVVLIKRTTHKTVRTEKTVIIEEFAPVPAQTREPDSSTLRASSPTATSTIQTPTRSTRQRSPTVITGAATDLSTDSSESDSSPVPVQRLQPDSLANLSPLLARERSLPQSLNLDQGSTSPLDLDTKVKAWKAKAKISPLKSNATRPKHYHIPNPSELQKFDGPHYYVVTVGQVVGIFPDWHFVSAVTHGISNAAQSKHRTWEAAFERYKKAFHGGWIRRQVLSGGPFDDGFDIDDIRSDGTFLNELEAGPSNIRK